MTVAVGLGIHAPALAKPKYSHQSAPATPPTPVAKVAAKRVTLGGAPMLGTAVPYASWSAGVADADSGPAQIQAGSLPIRVGGAAAPAAKLRVELLDRAASQRAGLSAVLLRVGRTDRSDAAVAARTATAVPISIDYRSFRNAYGADWGSRLRLVSLPECALTTPQAKGCRGVPVQSRNDARTGAVTATISVAAQGSSLMALTAGASGPAGSFDATPIAPSSSWASGGGTGDFNWTYSMRTPPALGGAAPEVKLSYSSQAIDGRTAASNNQPSEIGDGFEYSPGYIERRYKSCSDDMGGTATNTDKTGDLCQSATENLVLSLGGSSSELIYNATEQRWHSKKDDGTKVEKVIDTSLANGDDSGEYWKATTVGGVQYFFGRNRLPGWTSGQPETKSAWTVPVAGNNPGESCYNAVFADSFCDEAWRWNLDYIVDPNQNTTSFWYAPETNYYGRANDADKRTEYIRGGMLSRIDYGTQTTNIFGTAPAQVLFEPADRCSTATNCDPAVEANWKNWLDTPLDQRCDAGQACTNKFSPTFWTTKRLAKVTTQVWNGTAYRPVDQWILRHTWPQPTDGQHAGMWLAGITHKGVAGGEEITLPETVLTGTAMNNRVDTPSDNIYAYSWLRLTSIRTETGGQISVFYSDRDCVKDVRMPSAPDTNTLRCYPVKWQPEGFANPVTDYFHKYVVRAVTETDLTGGSPPVTTVYEYLGLPAWHHDTDDGLVKKENLTWGQWRGYEGIRVLRGDTGEQTRTESKFFRGMDGDVMADGSRRSVSIGSSDNDPAVPDSEAYNGMVREELAYDGDRVITGTVSTPWQSAATASKTVNDVVTEARFVNVAKVRSRTAIDHDSGWRRTVKTMQYDEYGMLTQTENLGDEAIVGSSTVIGDETCSKTTYARNTTAWIMDKAVKTESYARTCDTTPASADDVQGITRTFYDGATVAGTAPSIGNPTRVETLATWTSPTSMTFVAQQRAHYDGYGRVDQAFDLAGAKKTTAYATVSGGGVNKVTTTTTADSKLYTTIAELDPAWGATTASVDLNNNRSEVTYDALGRTKAVWKAGRPRSGGPSISYEYGTRTDGAVWTSTTAVTPSGGYLTSYSLLDSLLRKRQVQSPSPTAGQRIITEVRFDSNGRESLVLGPFTAPGAPGGDLVSADATLIYQQNRKVYDGAGRVTASVFQPRGVEKSRTSTYYGGDSVSSTPPQGGTGTTAINNAQGHTVALKQYVPGAGINSGTTTTYVYNRKGVLNFVTDDAGNTWEYRKDIRDRQVYTNDPDRGETTYTYDAADRLATVTDARGAAYALKYTYDGLGRKTGLNDMATNAKRATWTYDTASGGKGALATATRWIGSTAYKATVRGYTVLGQSTGTTVNLPASEGVLAGDYTFIVGYNSATDASVAGYTYGGRGDLLPETVSVTMDPATGLPSGVDSDYPGTNAYVKSTAYTGNGLLSGFVLTTDKHGSDEVYRDYFYDLNSGRLDHSTASTTSGGVVSSPHYTYDAHGNLTRISDPLAGNADTQCFEQDYLQRLTHAWTPADGDCATAGRRNDNLGGPAPYWQSWTYDDIGNRLTQTEHTASGDAQTDFHTPDGTHQLESTSGAITGSYDYDAAGNMTDRPRATGSQQLLWDAEGHLASVTEGTTVTSFVYDAGGERLLRKTAGTTTLYFGAAEFRLNTSTGAISETRTYNWVGQIVAQRTAAGVVWLVADHQNTANVAIDAATQHVTYRYQTPFGSPRGSPPSSWANERGFLGGQQDATGLTHLGAREYDPLIGRFVSVDPVMDTNDPQQMHGYAYANNSPIVYSDASGTRPVDMDDPEDPGVYEDTQAWYEKFREAHETAIEVRVAQIQLKWPGARVTISMSDNLIPGGSSRGNGNNGYADIICWNCTPGKVYIWEMKHKGGKAEDAGPAQLNRYVRQLQLQIGDAKTTGITVGKGPKFERKFDKEVPNRSNPNEMVYVEDGEAEGIQVYSTRRNDGTPRPTPSGNTKEGEGEGEGDHDPPIQPPFVDTNPKLPGSDTRGPTNSEQNDFDKWEKEMEEVQPYVATAAVVVIVVVVVFTAAPIVAAAAVACGIAALVSFAW